MTRDSLGAPQENREATVYCRRALRSEITKVTTYRLPLYVLGATTLLTLAGSTAITTLVDHALTRGDPLQAGGLDPMSAFLSVVRWAQFGLIIYAACIVHQEDEQGCLRTTTLVTPRRWLNLGAKTVIVCVGAGLAAIVIAPGSALLRCTVIDCATRVNPLDNAPLGKVGAIAGAIIYLTLISLFTFFISTIVNSGVIGMGAAITLTAVSPLLRALTDLARFLPDQAGLQMLNPYPHVPGELSMYEGGAVLLAWTLISGIAAVVSTQRRSVGA